MGCPHVPDNRLGCSGEQVHTGHRQERPAFAAAQRQTDRRRRKQIAHNEAHGITPKGVVKRIKDIIDGVYNIEQAQEELKAAQEMASYEHLTEKELTREVKQLEKEMLEAAKNLEFEKAAMLRDKLKELKHLLFGVSEHD